MLIGSIDIECLSRQPNAALIEVAAVSVNVDPLTYEPKSDFTTRDWSFNLLEQIITFQRHVDPNTIQFHEINRGSSKELLTWLNRSDTMYTAEILQELKTFCTDLDELWINGLSFDPMMLKNLAGNAKFSGELWDFKIERDLRTIRKTVGRGIPSARINGSSVPAHTGLKDAMWNLYELHNIFCRIEVKHLDMPSKVEVQDDLSPISLDNPA